MADEVSGQVTATTIPPHTTGTAGTAYPQHIITATLTQFSGQIPHPATLEQYETVMPGLPKMLVDEWRAEVAHRRSMDLREQERADRELTRNHQRQWRGMHLGFGAMVLMTAVGVYAIHAGQGAVGAAVLIAEIVGGAIAFIAGRGKPVPSDQDDPEPS